jgi:hypothetical protein
LLLLKDIRKGKCSPISLSEIKRFKQMEIISIFTIMTEHYRATLEWGRQDKHSIIYILP